jgi:hypothetical protein
MGRRTNHLRAARLFESPAVASHPLRQRFRFRTANVKSPARENFRSLDLTSTASPGV